MNTCIKRTTNPAISYCGRVIETVLSFDNIQHAIDAHADDQPTTVCNECLDEIQKKIDELRPVKIPKVINKTTTPPDRPTARRADDDSA